MVLAQQLLQLRGELGRTAKARSHFFVNVKRSIHQDRLGTGVGKTHKKTVFSQVEEAPAFELRGRPGASAAAVGHAGERSVAVHLSSNGQYLN